MTLSTSEILGISIPVTLLGLALIALAVICCFFPALLAAISAVLCCCCKRGGKNSSKQQANAGTTYDYRDTPLPDTPTYEDPGRVYYDSSVASNSIHVPAQATIVIERGVSSTDGYGRGNVGGEGVIYQEASETTGTLATPLQTARKISNMSVHSTTFTHARDGGQF